MLMSVGFSIVFYNTSSRELGRQLPPPELYRSQRLDENDDFNRPVNDFFQARITEGRQALLERLILLNIVTLVAGGALSYLLAEKTLRPIKKNMEAQEQFVSDASHELRTPLTALLTTNEVALRRKKITDTQAREIFEDNVTEITKLQSLTASLLRLAQRENEQVSLRAESVQDIVLDAVNHVVKQIQAKDITLHDTVPKLMVHADKNSLAQAIAIILDNAIKYSEIGSEITVSGSTQGRFVAVAITDNGPGIAPADLPYIFDRFYRADQTRNKRQTDGYGIGLALARKIVDQHAGELSAADAAGKGAVFTIKIPLSKNK